MSSGYINIEYDNINDFMNANKMASATLFRSCHTGTSYDELWFVVDTRSGAVILHRLTATADTMDSYLADEYDEEQGFEAPTILKAEFHWRKE